MDGKGLIQGCTHGGMIFSPQPTISIITPVKNGERYIEECIKSVIAQNYPGIEHIIVDGGSTDRTLQIVAKYADSVTLILAPGVFIGSSVNLGFKHSTGDIIGWLDADDKYPEGILQMVTDNMSAAKLLIGDYQIIDEAGHVTRTVKVNYNSRRQELFGVNRVHFASCFYHREVVESAGYLPDTGDFLTFFTNATAVYQAKYIPVCLAQWRVHPGNYSNQSDRNKRKVIAQVLKQRCDLARNNGANLANSSRVRDYLRYRVFDRLGVYAIRRKVMGLGNHWAVALQTWGQVAALVAMMNTVASLGTFYYVAAGPQWNIPIWLYILVALSLVSVFVLFVLFVGNPAWYRYAKRMTDIDIINEKLDKLLSERH